MLASLHAEQRELICIHHSSGLNADKDYYQNNTKALEHGLSLFPPRPIEVNFFRLESSGPSCTVIVIIAHSWFGMYPKFPMAVQHATAEYTSRERKVETHAALTLSLLQGSCVQAIHTSQTETVDAALPTTQFAVCGMAGYRLQ